MGPRFGMPLFSVGMPIMRMGEVQSMSGLVFHLVVDFSDRSSAFGGRFSAVFIFRSHAGLPARQLRDLNSNLTKFGGNDFIATGQ